MRTIAFALLLLGATACPAFASGTLIEAKSPTFGCQFSATLGLFQELSTVSEEIPIASWTPATACLSMRISASR